MKLLKKLFYALMVLVLAVCAVILLCAVNPDLTASLKTMLYGDGTTVGVLEKLGFGADDSSEDGTDASADATGSDGTSGTGKVTGTIVPSGDDSDTYVYQVPDGGTLITLPEEVADRTGLVPVSAQEAEEVDDQIAESLKSDLSQGETGEDLDFDTVFYPFYGMLSDTEKAVYRQIYANAKALNSSFAPVNSISADQLKNIFEAVTNDHPELFYLQTEYSVKYTQSGSVVEIILSYYTIANDIETSKSTFESAAQKIISGASLLETDLEKEKYVNDALIASVIYNAGAEMNQSAYSALVNGESVCAGYARAFQYCLISLGIPCYYCTGYSGEDHAWNIVKLDDNYYNEDVTWNDTDPSTYDYFNKSDSDFNRTHRRTSLSVQLPVCKASMVLSYSDDGSVTGQDDTSEEAADTTADGDSSGDSSGTGGHVKPLNYEDYIHGIVPDPDAVDDGTDSSGNGNSNGSSGNSNDGNGSGSGNDGTSDDGSTSDGDGSDSSDEDDSAVTITPAQIAELAKLGLSTDDVLWSIEDYYDDCKVQLVVCGSGDQHYSNIVPASLFDEIASAYGTGDYKTGYVDSALETLGMNHFSIQIQAQKLSSGFYKLYHNVVSWNE